jgi:ADP-ribosylglycohydrolase
LKEIPQENRLTDAILATLNWTEETNDWKFVWEQIHDKYGHYHSIHVIPNTCYIVMGLIMGEGDFEKSICTTVMAGGDTDCTSATVGSMVGAMMGCKALPEKWITPLQDRVKSLILNFQDMKISDLAKRTTSLIETGD